VTAEVAFTLMDFFACDVRYAGHFAQVPRSGWSAALVPAAECVYRETKGVPDKLPSLLLADGDNLLHKVIVDERLLREARRCSEAWRSLQELGGVHNSHAERLLARERQRWEEARAPAPAAAPVPAPAPAAAAAVPAAAAPAAAEKERPSEEPYIETPRCSSCDECIQINNKMFAYDANKQARIVDANAGTYRQLVEAAESCQVAIIHPGKPKNPNEPGLDELLKRAEAFA
jgi:ferredoxin